MKGLIAFSILMIVAAPASAKDIVVQMKNAGAGGMMVFNPPFVKASVGDTVRFMPTDPGHNAESIDGMLPAGVASFEGQMSKEFDLKITKPGLYGIKCKPHFSMGMVALVQAGTPSNKGAASSVKLPPLATRRMAPLLASVR